MPPRAAPMRPSRYPDGRPLWSVREGVDVVDDGRTIRLVGCWEDTGRPVDVVLVSPSTVVREALRRMRLGPVALENVAGLAESYRNWRRDGEPDPVWRRLKSELDELGGSVVPSLGFDDSSSPALSVLGVEPDATFAIGPELILADTVVVGARGVRELPGAYEPTLTSDTATHHVVLHQAPARDVARAVLRGPATPSSLARSLGRDVESTRGILVYLTSAGVTHVVRS